MNWPYRHPTRGTCTVGCHMYGLCHCGCGGHTNRAREARPSDGEHAGDPRVFISHHFQVSQWRERNPARCHPDKPNHGRGLCRYCYRRWEWQKTKRANRRRDRKTVTDWERARFSQFLVLTRSGLGRDEAMRQLERDVPSEFPEMETG